MSGDNLHGDQSLKFYSFQMTKAKTIAIDHYKKKLVTQNISKEPLNQQNNKSELNEAA